MLNLPSPEEISRILNDPTTIKVDLSTYFNGSVQAMRIVIKGTEGVFLVAESPTRFRIVSGLTVTSGMPNLSAVGIANILINYDEAQGSGTILLPSETGGTYPYRVTAG